MAVPLMDKQPQLLVDTAFVNLALEEGSDGKKLKVKGEFAKADIATENGRVYPRALWEREIGRLTHSIRDRKVLGELDHPSDGKTMLQRASHVVTRLELRDDGVLVGQAEALDTSKGKDLQALVKGNVKVGVSSRGFGSVKKDADGKDVVQEDYRLATFDFVADPADSTAYPDPYYESKEKKMTVEDQKALNEQIEEAVKAREASLREEFSGKLPGLISKAVAEAKEQLRGDLLTDPSVAGAKSVLEQLKPLLLPYILPEDTKGVVEAKDQEIEELKRRIAERDLEIKGLKEDVEGLSKVAKEAGYKYFLERMIGAHGDADLIRKLVGDLTLYESSDAVKEKVESVQKDLSEQRKIAEENEQRALAEEQAKNSEIEKLRQMNAELAEAVQKTLEANKIQALRLHAEDRLLGNPQAPTIRELLRETDLTNLDTDAVDALVERYSKAGNAATDTSNEVRNRIRSMKRGRTYTPQEEEKGVGDPGRSKLEENYNGLGVSLSEIKALSGVV